MNNQQPKTSSFITLILVFFFWGFVAASNDILIPVFKEKLHLAQWQGQMVSFAFYVAYTVGSIIYILQAIWVISARRIQVSRGKEKYGFKRAPLKWREF